MKFLGVDTWATPVDKTPGVFEVGYNPRLRVDGEARRRRGLAASNLAQLSGAVTTINGFALNAGSGFAIVGSSGQLDGKETPLALWGDAALVAMSGTSNPYTSSVFRLILTRGSSTYMTSAIVFAQSGRYPTDSDTGTYVGETVFDPWDTSASISWTAPASGSWYFRVYPVREGIIGPGANMTRTNYAIGLYSELHSIVITGGFSLPYPAFCSAVAAYVTNDGTSFITFDVGQALTDGAITLPYVYTLTTVVGIPGPSSLIVIGHLMPTPGALLLPGFGVAPGLIGTVTINADGTESLV